jgi:molybdopterin-synthase adenylyltransferase
MDFRMRMQKVHFDHMTTLLSDTSTEQACFLLCSIGEGRSATTFLIQEIIPLLDGDYSIKEFDQLVVKPEAILRVSRRASLLKASVCMVHTHPMIDGPVTFSIADDLGNVRTFDFFHRMNPSRFHSCLVWDGKLDHFSGRVYSSKDSWQSISKIVIVSALTYKAFESERILPRSINDRYSRQEIFFGESGQKALSNLRVAIVGLGGIGSIAVQQLVHGGVRDFLLIDDDQVETSNLPRVVGSSAIDVEQGLSKTEVAGRYIQQVSPFANVTKINARVESYEATKYLVDADLIISGTDTTRSRFHLNQVCHQYLIPVLDLGCQFALNPSTNAIESESARHNFMHPGDPCLACAGFLDPELMRIEGLSQDERLALRAQGYIQGSIGIQPSMMPFNSIVVSNGVIDVLAWISGSAGSTSDEYSQLHLLGVNSARGSKSIRKRKKLGCVFCSERAVFSARGDSEQFLLKQPK